MYIPRGAADFNVAELVAARGVFVRARYAVGLSMPGSISAGDGLYRWIIDLV